MGNSTDSCFENQSYTKMCFVRCFHFNSQRKKHIQASILVIGYNWTPVKLVPTKLVLKVVVWTLAGWSLRHEYTWDTRAKVAGSVLRWTARIFTLRCWWTVWYSLYNQAKIDTFSPIAAISG